MRLIYAALPLLFLPFTTAVVRGGPKDVFEKRLLPIFKSPNPSSCVQCHLAGVDLKNYIRPSHEQTFVSLRDQGLIDLDNPEKSKILSLIQMGKEDAGAALIHKNNRSAEYEAFAEWIKESARDTKLRDLPKATPSELQGAARPLEVVRHARKDRLVQSFESTIWAMRFRCMSCHIEGTPENKKLIEKNGSRVAWFKKGGPEATLEYLMQSKLIDVNEPAKSLLMLKPLNEVEHGGGKKFIKGDQSYRTFLAFLEDYARIKKDAYPTAASLPEKKVEPLRFGTNIWIKLANTPPAWGDRLLQVNLYAWDKSKGAWEAEPVASTDRLVWGKGKMWQHTLTLEAAAGSDRAKTWKANAQLAAGKYLAKVYVDDGKASDITTPFPRQEHYVGQAEVQSAWPDTYGRMTVIDAGKVKK